jgi:uncharacterized glyoxalase superfamily protein PhnB/uncharacterized damage-inducible protein DinB
MTSSAFRRRGRERPARRRARPISVRISGRPSSDSFFTVTWRMAFNNCLRPDGAPVHDLRRQGDSLVFEFLVDTYRTERLKTLSVWSQVPDARMTFRTEPRARTPLEHMVHQCASEDAWMRNMLGIATGLPVLPARETRLDFLNHYAACSTERLTALEAKADSWFQESTQFFDVVRTRAWVLTRRFAHSAHHRGQLTAYLRQLGAPLYSTYGPTADTGGLAPNGATVVYRYASIGALVAGESAGGATPYLPGVGTAPPTERPGPDGNAGGTLASEALVSSVSPDGWHNVTPRLVVHDAARLVAFLKHVFGATGDLRDDRPSLIRIGDSLVMISSPGPRDRMPGFLYVYVDDVDATFRRAMDAGAVSLEDPQDLPYGDRRGMVQDPCGNIWQIATRRVPV